MACTFITVDELSKNALSKFSLKFDVNFCCSYVLASYARFLWDAEEEEDEEEQNKTDHTHNSSTNFFHGASHRSHLTAA